MPCHCENFVCLNIIIIMIRETLLSPDNVNNCEKICDQLLWLNKFIDIQR